MLILKEEIILERDEKGGSFVHVMFICSILFCILPLSCDSVTKNNIGGFTSILTSFCTPTVACFLFP
jgi:hypothetical protein